MQEWKPLDEMSTEEMRRLASTREMFVVIGIDVKVGVSKYTTDPYCVWVDLRGDPLFIRWIHKFSPTHYMLLPSTK